MGTIAGFTGLNRYLSNFWMLQNPVFYEGMAFSSVEHAYQAAKFKDRKNQRLIQAQTTPGNAKRIARRLRPVRDDWHKVKVIIMEDLVFQKFRGNPELAAKLISTEGDDLVEMNTWHDNFWGICICEQDCNKSRVGLMQIKRGIGENMLGRMLMRVRAQLIEERTVA